ncbi:putative ribosomal protein P1/P2 [Helianthus debilis subsp. tardiflorus]
MLLICKVGNIYISSSKYYSIMKVEAAYLLVVLAGNTFPSADDLRNIHGSVYTSKPTLKTFNEPRCTRCPEKWA